MKSTTNAAYFDNATIGPEKSAIWNKVLERIVPTILSTFYPMEQQ